MNSLRQDLRYAVRTLARKRGFAAMVVLTLALGIGASTAIFSVMHAVILRPLPFRDPDRIVQIYEHYPKGGRFRRGSDQGFITVRPGSYFDWKDQSRTLTSVSAYAWRSAMLTGGSEVEVVSGHEVTPEFFETLGTAAQVGRTFVPEDYRDGRSLILSYELWQSRYGGDTSVAGRKISLDNAEYTVVGVMPRGFYPTRIDPPKFWLPKIWDPRVQHSRVNWGLTTYARMKDGVTLEQVQREFDVISDRLSAAYSEHYDNMCAVVVPAAGYLFSQYEKFFALLLGAVALLLLIACANVANLLMARGAERGREFALRAALGAARGRLIRQLLTESVLLAGAGGVLGIVLARIGVRPLLALFPAASRVPRLDSVELSIPVLIFTFGVALLTGMLFGLAPALRLSHPDLNDTLKESGRGNSEGARARRWTDLLVATEVALALVLLVAATSLVRSFRQLLTTDPGFRPERVLALSVAVPNHHYGSYRTGEANPSRARLFAELERRTSEIPGVAASTVTGLLPLRHGPNPWSMHIVGMPAPPPVAGEYGGAARTNKTGLYNHGSISIERVSPRFFETFGIALRSGRVFTQQDSAGRPMVTVINEAAAKLFQGEDPIGKSIIIDMTSYFPRMTVVGIVADSKMNALDKASYPTVYWPMEQMPSANAWVAIRTAGAPSSVAAAVQSAIRQFDSDLAITEVQTMPAVMSDSLWRPRFAAVLIGVFAAIAAALTAAGIYAVFSYMVTRRTQEMGLRVALGASRRQIVELVLWSAMRVTAAGIIAGIVGALLLGSVLTSQFNAAAPNDAVVITCVAGSLAVIAMLASLRPAMRATGIDPLVALRQE
jgi:putative ABC transport system permease protein